MRMIDMKCTNCGAMLELSDSRNAICPYCNSKFLVDDGTVHIQYDNAEEAGYQFEKGKRRAQLEQRVINEKLQKDNSIRQQRENEEKFYSQKAKNSFAKSIVALIFVCFLLICEMLNVVMYISNSGNNLFCPILLFWLIATVFGILSIIEGFVGKKSKNFRRKAIIGLCVDGVVLVLGTGCMLVTWIISTLFT